MLVPRRIQVLLAVEPRLLREALREVLSHEPDIVLVGEVVDPVDILVEVGVTGADTVILSWSDAAGGRPAILSHLFAEYPGLLVIGITPGAQRVCSWRASITTTPMSDSLHDVLIAIRNETAAALD